MSEEKKVSTGNVEIDVAKYTEMVLKLDAARPKETRGVPESFSKRTSGGSVGNVTSSGAARKLRRAASVVATTSEGASHNACDAPTRPIMERKSRKQVLSRPAGACERDGRSQNFYVSDTYVSSNMKWVFRHA